MLSLKSKAATRTLVAIVRNYAFRNFFVEAGLRVLAEQLETVAGQPHLVVILEGLRWFSLRFRGLRLGCRFRGKPLLRLQKVSNKVSTARVSG